MELHETVAHVLATFDNPPTVTDLRQRLEEKFPFRDPEHLREVVFGMIYAGKLKLTENYRLYR